jgi:homoserine dehydrogenase
VDVSDRVVRVGMLGCGIVGSAVLRLLDARSEELLRRAGARFEVTRVAVRDPGRSRDVPASASGFTGDPGEVVSDPRIDVVVETMGGIEPARSLLLDALRAGKPVVTANKELLASHGQELFDAAAEADVGLHLEAAVAAGIPLIRPVRDSLAGEQVTRLLGIVNGTTNYILHRMTEDGMAFGDALGEAQRLGYAERDPADDLEGYDAAAKCAILASLAFNTRVRATDVYREGIASVSPEDIAFADRLGYVVKLLAVAELEDGEVAARVHPAMIPAQHPLAAVRDAYNAVFVHGPGVGELMFYGRGAGGEPTAVAVVGDVVAAAEGSGFRHPWYLQRRVRPMEAMEAQFYLLLDVVDRPGVLAKIAGAFGENKVSIKSVWQEGTGEDALIVMITHRGNEGALQQTVRDLRDLDVVLEVRSVMRVEDEG